MRYSPSSHRESQSSHRPPSASVKGASSEGGDLGGLVILAYALPLGDTPAFACELLPLTGSVVLLWVSTLSNEESVLALPIE
jgi:hypothetical protein